MAARTFSASLGFGFLVLAMAFVANTHAATWTSEVVVGEKIFWRFHPRAIAVDSSNNPHIAYGDKKLYHAYYDGSSWHYEVVDSSAGVGQYASIALDSSDKVHISYWDSTNNDLKYATNASGAWVPETLDSSGDKGETTSIAIDSSNYVHISYYDAGNHDLKYATNASGAWVPEIIDSAGYVGKYSCITLDSSDYVHISYYDGSNADLKYATNAFGLWVSDTVEVRENYGVGVGEHTCIAVDSLNRVHITYNQYDELSGWRSAHYIRGVYDDWPFEHTKVLGSALGGSIWSSIVLDAEDDPHIVCNDGIDGLLYLTKESDEYPGTDWEEFVVDSEQQRYASIAMDSLGKVHISGLDSVNRDLKYSTNASGSWTSGLVDTEYRAGWPVNLALDSSDKVHISHHNLSSKDLNYASNASGHWVNESLSEQMTGAYKCSAIAVDSQDYLHLGYGDEEDRLNYITNASGVWLTEPVDYGTGGFVWDISVSDISLAVDSSDKVHIGYYDEYYGELKYSTNASSTWTKEVADDSDRILNITDMAIDSLGNAHMSYNQRTAVYPNRNLNYATNLSGLWECEVVDSGDTVGLGNSIAVDTLDKLHISYIGGPQTDRNLYYATNTAGLWDIEPVDDSGAVSIASSIALDLSGNVHIVYRDLNQGLRYATNASGFWEKETVLPSEATSSSGRIALDSQGQVHIVYLSGFNLMHAVNAVTYKYQPDQVNDGAANKSRGCGTPPTGLGSLFQSFTPSKSSLGAVDLRLRAGGEFPEEGLTITVKIRSGTFDGELLGTTTASISGPKTIGEQCNVRFTFSPPELLIPGETYVLEWMAPQGGDAVLTWMVAENNPYPGGMAIGCFGIPIPEEDFIFTTYTLADYTPEGADVKVILFDDITGTTPVTLNFQEVTGSGISSLATYDAGQALPAGFMLGNPPTYYKVNTTAQYLGLIEMCVNYTGISFDNEEELKLFHYENGTWLDVTTFLDTENNIVCGRFDSFSTFVICEPKVDIDTTLSFFDASVAEGTLVGNGPGESAKKRLKILRSKIQDAGELIEKGNINGACHKLLWAYNHTDGNPDPLDFVKGEAAPKLAHILQKLIKGML
jgi:hypothetical protein